MEKYKIINSPQTPNFSSETDREFCAEAQQKLMWRICREIHNCWPDKEVFTVHVLRFTYAADEDF